MIISVGFRSRSMDGSVDVGLVSAVTHLSRGIRAKTATLRRDCEEGREENIRSSRREVATLCRSQPAAAKIAGGRLASIHA